MRPGGAPDFSDVDLPGGRGRGRRVDVAPEEIRDLAYTIIRVLDREGEAVGPWAGLLSDEELLEGLRHMMTLARVRRAHADGAAAGQDLVLHAAPGRGGGELRLPQARSSPAT